MSGRILLALSAMTVCCSPLGAQEPGTLLRASDGMNARQLREEQAERLLVNLESRCRKLLHAQITIDTGIKNLQRGIERNAGKEPTPLDRETAKQLATNMAESIRETTKIIKFLEKEGSAVAFIEVFQLLRDDMKTVQRRLARCDVGPHTQEIEADIVDTFREMISALIKTRCE
jgi:hypothetical protein